MRLLMRFMKPYRRLVAVTLLVLLIDNVGTLLVPTMLANMVNTGITTGDIDIAERIRYDIWYIENWTVALDIKIIFRTVFGGKMVNDEKLQ